MGCSGMLASRLSTLGISQPPSLRSALARASSDEKPEGGSKETNMKDRWAAQGTTSDQAPGGSSSISSAYSGITDDYMQFRDCDLVQATIMFSKMGHLHALKVCVWRYCSVRCGLNTLFCCWFCVVVWYVVEDIV